MSGPTRPTTLVAVPHGEGRTLLSLGRRADGSPLGREPTLAGAVRLAASIASALTIAVCVIGLVVRLAFAGAARHWLAFPFSGIPARPAEAASIFVNNLHALAAVAGLLLIAQSPYSAVRTAEPGVFHRALQRIGDALLAAAVAANVIVVGASLGAYGTRMVRATLPHGPVELGAYALALALYHQGRRRPLPTRHMLAVAGLSISALALAAALETFINP